MRLKAALKGGKIFIIYTKRHRILNNYKRHKLLMVSNKLRVVFYNETTSHLVISDQQLQPSFNFNVKSEKLMLY